MVKQKHQFKLITTTPGNTQRVEVDVDGDELRYFTILSTEEGLRIEGSHRMVISPDGSNIFTLNFRDQKGKIR